jgi:hypothetical protein
MIFCFMKKNVQFNILNVLGSQQESTTYYYLAVYRRQVEFFFLLFFREEPVGCFQDIKLSLCNLHSTNNLAALVATRILLLRIEDFILYVLATRFLYITCCHTPCNIL